MARQRKARPDPGELLPPAAYHPSLTPNVSAAAPLSEKQYRELAERGARSRGTETPSNPEDEAHTLNLKIAEHARRILLELAQRRCESLHIYTPLPFQQQMHACPAQHCLILGGNRSGKTLSAAVEIARALTGQDPHDKYPRADGRCYAVGKDLAHCGAVMYRKLFRAGAFFIIRDLGTNRWRTYNPNDPDDVFREKEKKPAPPLIPQRFVKSVSWLDKKASIPKIIKLINGWEISFLSSEAKPPQGVDLDLIWFDEEITDPEWLPEMQARILDRLGRILWSATPQNGTEHLLELYERAEEESHEPEPTVVAFNLLLGDNTFMSAKAKKLFISNIRTEEERQVRVEGKFAINSYRVYPEYGTRCFCDWFEIPRDWSIYVGVDPGRQRCAAAFWAVPPPKLHDPHHYLFDELYIKDADAEKFGEMMELKLRGRQTPVAFLIDNHEGRKHDTGSGKSIRHQYSEALRKRNVRSHTTGHDFIAGTDDLKGGIEAVRSYWKNCDDDRPKLLILRPANPGGERECVCPSLDHELRHYHYKRVKGLVTDEVVKKNDHLCDTIRYLSGFGPRWRPVRSNKRKGNYAVEAMRRKRERQRKAQGRHSVNLGPV
jgi:hypothetical protein